MYKRHNLFTLIELLVVVAVIIILIAMLMPALSKVRVRAKRVLELSDRRQTGQATAMYADDNSGRYPTPYDRARWDQLHVFYYQGGLDFRTALFKEYVGGGKDLWHQFMFCQSDLLKARYPDANAWYGWDQTYVINAGTVGYYGSPKEGWNIPDGNWSCEKFNTSSVAKARPSLPMWACMLFEKRGPGEWFGHDALANVTPYTYPVGANTVYFDGSGEWVEPKHFALMFRRRSASEYWWIPNKNDSVKGVTQTFNH